MSGKKIRRGTVRGVLVGVRLQPNELAAIDAYQQAERLPSRGGALRELAMLGAQVIGIRREKRFRRPPPVDLAAQHDKSHVEGGKD
jgi:hypothetical protein